MKIGWGIDVGVGSIGFAVIALDGRGRPARLIDGVARVYPVPTGGAERTGHKSMRTQNLRKAKRIKALRTELVRLLNLGPHFVDTPAGRPTARVRLRKRGLTHPLKAGDLARAILHIAKNRGQRLTRGLRDDAGSDAAQQKANARERAKMADTANTTKRKLADLGQSLGIEGAAYPAQLLMDQAGKIGATRLKKDRDGRPVFTRAMMRAELEALLKTQQRFHPVLTDEVCAKLRQDVFWEAEPKPPMIGKCRYGERGADGKIETRLPCGSDLFQRKRIYEEVNNLRIVSHRGAADECLNPDQRNALVARLLDGQDLTAAKVRKVLGLGRGALADLTSLDIQRKGRKTEGKLEGHPLAAAFKKAGALEQWQGFGPNTRERIAEWVRTEDNTEILTDKLAGLGVAENVIQSLCETRLSAKYSAAGRAATSKLLVELERDVISNYCAEQRAGLDSLEAEPEPRDRLPYYGEILKSACVAVHSKSASQLEASFGRIPNPVVHVALNQLRKTANAYLELYGKPAQICVELARDLNKSAKEREEAEKQARTNRQANEKYIETLKAHKRRLTREHLKRLKLHQMQDGRCLYTDRPICKEQLFRDVEIDHILPRAVTRDDSLSNLALVFKEANQFKGKRPPFEAFGDGYKDQDYEHILARAWARGGGVYWRFQEDAMDRYQDQDKVQARFLNDTRYIAKMAARYLSCVCEDRNGVVALNGRITSDLRHEWGLHTVIGKIMVADGRLDLLDIQSPKGGETLKDIQARCKRADKVRWDHRHHLLDAIVAACTTRSDVQRLQTLAARGTSGESASEIRRTDPDAGLCWQHGFHRRVRDFLQNPAGGGATGAQPVTRVVVKADHDTHGQLHKATNYGLICKVPGAGDQYVARDHVAISDLDAKKIKELGVPEKAKQDVSKAKEQGLEFWWGGPAPVFALCNLDRDLKKMRKRLLELMQATPDAALAKANTDKGLETARAEWAKSEYIKRTGRRRFTRVQIVSLRVLKGPLDRGKKPRQANPTGGNDRLICFVNGAGVRDIEVVSTLDANTPGFQERWHREGGRPLFVLRKNDLLEMRGDPGDPTSPRRLYRVVSISGTGRKPDLEFVPVEEARSGRPPKSVRIRSSKKFWDHAPVLVVCDPTGRVRWRSPRLN